MSAPGSASFVTTRQNPRGIFTDFAPPNTLLGVLGIPIGTLVKQVDHQTPGLRARPLASDFAAPNTLLGAFVHPTAPFVPPPTADNAQHLKTRWSAIDFAAPNLSGRLLGPPPAVSVDTAGDIRLACRGVYSDFLAPNVLLSLPPPQIGPYVPVEIGTEIKRNAVYTDFAVPNLALNTIALIGAGQSFKGTTLEGHTLKRWGASDFTPPNFLTTSAALTTARQVPGADLPNPHRAPWAATDFAPPNVLLGTFNLFFGNPPKTTPDPQRYGVSRPSIHNDSPPPNFLTSVAALAINTPLSARDDGLITLRARAAPTDFITPNLFAGQLIQIAPPQPPAPITVPLSGQPLLPYTFTDPPTAYRRISEAVNQLIRGKGGGAGTYNPIFQSGQVQYVGPSNQLAGNDNLIFGLIIPNPAGTPGPALLTGSGGGGGSNVVFWFITDQAFDTLSPGNDIYHTAGETQPGSSARGGKWTAIGGASDQGPGGPVLLQGGTSVGDRAGDAILQGGNSTGKVAPPGDAFVIGGLVGNTGGNVHLIATLPDGSSVYGVIRHRGNSIIRWDEFVGDGSWFFYDGSGFGAAGAPVVSKGPGQPVGFATDGANGTFTSQDGKTITVTQGRITAIN